MPWIHIDDAVNIFYTALIDENFKGVYNTVPSEHVNNRKLTHEMKIFNKTWLPNVPSHVIKLITELSSTILLGVKVSNEKIKNCGFSLNMKKYQRL